MEPVGGSMLGRYEVIRHLASGGMADLLLAKASGLEGFERHVVIKRIRADAEDDQAFIEMFLVEARLAGALHHHNIVQVYDVGEEKGKPYFAMEYVHGEDLRRLLTTVVQKRQPLPLPVIVTIVAAVARALHHAHEQKGSDQQPLHIVHRDVSPANIVVGYDGNVKVLDFGIARAAMRRTETQAGMLKGKAPYMAPEQCTGGAVDRRSDVFALGIVLYELTTARRLFKAENDHLTMMTIVNGTIPKPSTIRKGLPPDLERIIMRALSRDPGSRYQSAEQMFTALEQLAMTAEWRTSASVLATFMTQLFGSRTEPWLSKEPIAADVSVDFDGPGTGVAVSADADNGAVPTAVTSTASSPIMRARSDAQVSSGVPKAADATVSSPIKIPNPSVGTKSAGGKTATRVPVTATPPRGRPKTVQVPVPKSAAKQDATVDLTSEAAKTQVKAAPKPDDKPASLDDTAVLAVAAAPAKPGAKVDPASLENTTVLAPPIVAARPDTDVAPPPPANRASSKTDVTRVDRPSTEADQRPNPIMDSEGTHTDAQALPPAISPHAPRQLRQLPAPSVAKQITPKPLAKLPEPTTATEAPSKAPGAEKPTAAATDAAINGKRADGTITAPTMASSPASKAAAAQPAAAAPHATADDDFAEDRSATASDVEDSTEVASIPKDEDSPFASTRRADPTAIVVPLPSPMRTESSRARRKSTSPVDAGMMVGDGTGTDQLAAARPRWMFPAIGGGVVLLAIIVFAIARSGGDDLDNPPPETASVTEPAKPPVAAAAPAPDEEVRTEAQPRTWANSQQADPVGSAAQPPTPKPTPTRDPDPTPKPTPPAPDPEPPVAVEPVTETAAVIPPTEPDPPADPPTPPEPDPIDPIEPVVAAKPTPKPVPPKLVPAKPAKPKTTPAIAKTPKPVARPAAVAKTTKPAVKPTPKPKASPKANWNPNSLFPNKK